MKLTKSQLKQIIKEEFQQERSIGSGHPNVTDYESEYRPSHLVAFDKMKELYNSADPDRKEWFENKLIEEFKTLVNTWREERKNS